MYCISHQIRLCFSPLTPSWHCYTLRLRYTITNKKRGARPDARSTLLGLRIALPVETSNVESPTPMCDIYVCLWLLLDMKSN